MKQHVPAIAMGFILAAGLFGLLWVMTSHENEVQLLRTELRLTQMVRDSVKYAHRWNELQTLSDQQRASIDTLKKREIALTFARDEALRRIGSRSPSRIRNADSLRTAILRESGFVHPR